MRNTIYGLLAGALIAGSPVVSLAATPAEDRFLIMELMDRYGIVHDFGTPQEFAALFTDDAVIASDGRVTTSGRDAMLKRGEQDQRRYTFQGADGKMSSFMRHVISNRQVKLTGDTTAEGSCYVITMINDKEAGPHVFSISRYVDRYRKVEGEWRIEYRNIIGESGNPELARKWFR